MNLRAGRASPGHGTAFHQFIYFVFKKMRPRLGPPLAIRRLAAWMLEGTWVLGLQLDRVQELRRPRGKSAKSSFQAVQTLVERVFREFPPPTRPTRLKLATFFRGCEKHEKLAIKLGNQIPEDWRPVHNFNPTAGNPAKWEIPVIQNVHDLARWLGISGQECAFLAAPWRPRERRSLRFENYRQIWVQRKNRTPRLIEAPLPRLKAVQQRILQGILKHIPPHSAAHGFLAGRNTRSHVNEHLGKACVVKMDVQDFFPSIRRARVFRVFYSAGYPEAVAGTLANLCTTHTPENVCMEAAAHCSAAYAPIRRRQLWERHLPQGAPTSPALANLCCFPLDCRLAGLAKRFGGSYSRYADDLLFSGGADFKKDAQRLQNQVAVILLEEGLAAAHRKSRIMPESTRQIATSIVLNVHANLSRKDRDALKALLHNCVTKGPASQNRDAHPDFQAYLLGKLSHLSYLNPASGEKLRRIFDEIVWV